MPIKIEKLNHIYNYKAKYAFHALKDITLNIKDNTFTAIIGKTGCGKSTLLQHLNGLLIPYSGKVDVNGFIIDISNEYKNGEIRNHLMNKKRKKKIKNIKDLRKKVGVAFQFPENQLFEDTVIKDVTFGPKNFGLSEEEASSSAKKALDLVGIDNSFYERNPFELSGGEKRKVSIAGILAFNPEILVLDEPTAGLDNESKNNLLDTLLKLKEKGITIIISTHDMDVVLKYADDVIVLDSGKLITQTSPSDLFINHFNLIKESEELPKALDYAIKLNNKGFKIDLKKVKDSLTLVKEIEKEL